MYSTPFSGGAVPFGVFTFRIDIVLNSLTSNSNLEKKVILFISWVIVLKHSFRRVGVGTFTTIYIFFFIQFAIIAIYLYSFLYKKLKNFPRWIDYISKNI